MLYVLDSFKRTGSKESFIQELAYTSHAVFDSLKELSQKNHSLRNHTPIMLFVFDSLKMNYSKESFIWETTQGLRMNMRVMNTLHVLQTQAIYCIHSPERPYQTLSI